MPEGKVPLARDLSVTFSQPMVAVTSQSDAAGVTPVKLTPTPKGNWRWIGTRTILFDPTVRFPQATTYQVEVPAGTKSANGGALKTATKFTFETPPPTLVPSYPNAGTPQRLDAPMFLVFDQKIDTHKRTLYFIAGFCRLAALRRSSGWSNAPYAPCAALRLEAGIDDSPKTLVVNAGQLQFRLGNILLVDRPARDLGKARGVTREELAGFGIALELPL